MIKPLVKLDKYKWHWYCQCEGCNKELSELRDVWPHLHIDHNIELGTLRLSGSMEFVYSMSPVYNKIL